MRVNNQKISINKSTYEKNVDEMFCNTKKISKYKRIQSFTTTKKTNFFDSKRVDVSKRTC